MGTKHVVARPAVATALFSRVQGRVLALLFGQAERQFQSAELIRLVAAGSGATHRVLRDLAAADLVSVTAIGNQRHYRANAAHPVFAELRGLVLKTSALAEPLRHALSPLGDRISEAFVFGSVAKGRERGASDVDLLVVSADLEYAELYEALAGAEQELGRRVEPMLITPAEWERKRRLRDGFVKRVSESERILIIGPRDDADRVREPRARGTAALGAVRGGRVQRTRPLRARPTR